MECLRSHFTSTSTKILISKVLINLYLHMLPKHGPYLNQMSGGWVCLKERCFDVFLERNKITKHGEKRYNYELYETFNE